jgi:LacI family gluconate utilization system Gnt-I transcriptional repressor
MTIAEYIRRKGYQRPGLIWTADPRAARRKTGLCDALSGHGVPLPTCIDAPLPATLAFGRHGLSQLLEQNQPDVVVCSSDTLAQGAIMEAESRGLRVPQDLAVMGFGDLDFAASNRPTLTTVGIDRREMGRRAATLLADSIAGDTHSDAIVDIGFQLIERESA